MQRAVQMLEMQLLIGCCLLTPICSLSLPYDPLQLQDVSIEENAIDDVGREMAEKGAHLDKLRMSSGEQQPSQTQYQQKHEFAYRPWELEYYKTSDRSRGSETESSDDADSLVPQTYNNMKREEKNDTKSYVSAEKREQSLKLEAPEPDDVKVEEKKSNDIYFIIIVAACSAAAVIGVIGAGCCWYRFQRNVKATADAEYPAYGVTGPTPVANKDAPAKSGDRKLAQYAHMYHYQHQKQQMIAMESKGGNDRTGSSDIESDEDNGENDDTVYECPGLAPTGELEVKNPLFEDEPTPMTPAMKEPPQK